MSVILYLLAALMMHSVSISSAAKIKSLSSFSGKSQYRAVALISIDSARKKEEFCTGSFISTPRGGSGQNVLTAAHCFFNAAAGIWTKNLNDLAVEFGVTSKSSDPVKCSVSDVLINPKYATEDTQTRRQFDYAIVKLSGCAATERGKKLKMPSGVTLGIFQNNKIWNEEYKQYGYGGTRVLREAIAPKVSQSKLKTMEKAVRHIMLDLALRGGDSGGPLFRALTGRQCAIVTGEIGYEKQGSFVPEETRAVKIYQDVYDWITNLCRSTPVNALSIKNNEGCQYASSNELCWSVCNPATPSTCYVSKKRGFLTFKDGRSNVRYKRNCKNFRSGKEGVQYLCNKQNTAAKAEHLRLDDDDDFYYQPSAPALSVSSSSYSSLLGLGLVAVLSAFVMIAWCMYYRMLEENKRITAYLIKESGTV